MIRATKSGATFFRRMTSCDWPAVRMLATSSRKEEAGDCIRGIQRAVKAAREVRGRHGRAVREPESPLDREGVGLAVARHLREARRGLRTHPAAGRTFLVGEAHQLELDGALDLPRVREVRERGIDVVPVVAAVDADRPAARLALLRCCRRLRPGEARPSPAARPRRPQTRPRARSVPSCDSFRRARPAGAERKALEDASARRSRLRKAPVAALRSGPAGSSLCLSRSQDCLPVLKVSVVIEPGLTASEDMDARSRCRLARRPSVNDRLTCVSSVMRRSTGWGRQPRARARVRPQTDSPTCAAPAAGT